MGGRKKNTLSRVRTGARCKDSQAKTRRSAEQQAKSSSPVMIGCASTEPCPLQRRALSLAT